MPCGNINKLKILFITSDSYPPYRPAARAIFWEELVNRGHLIDWVLPSGDPCDKPYVIQHGKGNIYIGSSNNGSSRWHRLIKNLNFIRNDLRMFKLTFRNKYHIIQVKDKYLSALFALILARFSKTHFVYWLAYPHAEANIYAAQQNVARYRKFYYMRGVFFEFVLYKIILPAADHIFVQSEQMKKDIQAKGIPLEKMTPIPGSLSLENIPFSEGANEKTTHNLVKENSIVYLGTLIRERRLDFLVRVLKEILIYKPNVQLIFIGSGENKKDEEFLLNEIKSLQVEHAVVFTGYLPMSDAWLYVREAAVCVSPYFPTPILNSTSPTKLIEYMAMGKAVVGNDHPEQSLVITESGCGLCTPWDETKFAQAVLYLLENSELAKEMGSRGRLYVEKYRTNSKMADIVLEEYNQLRQKK